MRLKNFLNMNDYNGLILAAGRGSRMGVSTKNSHKCLTILEGKTLIDWQLYSLKQSGVKNVTVIGGYNSDKIMGDFDKKLNLRWSETNMVYSFFCENPFEKDTIVTYSDIVFSSKHVKELIEKEGDIVITSDKLWIDLWSKRFKNPLEDAESFKTSGDNLIEIGNKVNRIESIESQYMGLLKLSPKGWEIAFNLYMTFDEKERDIMDMTTFLSHLIKITCVKVVFVEGNWCEIDTTNDLNVYNKLLKSTDKWSHDWRN